MNIERKKELLNKVNNNDLTPAQFKSYCKPGEYDEFIAQRLIEISKPKTKAYGQGRNVTEFQFVVITCFGEDFLREN